jgi:hypothetical protein
MKNLQFIIPAIGIHLIVFCQLLFFSKELIANPWIDEVVSISYGAGAGFGQDDFPENIYGPPDSTASAYVPSADSAEILSLGTGGEIVVYFNEGIGDGAGVDFTIFENVFFAGQPPQAFTETGIVALSVDGILWVEYPWDADTYSGLAGVTPTNGAADPLDAEISGGDSFDLSQVGLSEAWYLRISDAADLVPDSGSAFDLDAVAVIHSAFTDIGASTKRNSSRLSLSCWPNPFNGIISIASPYSIGKPWSIKIYNLSGQLVLNKQESAAVYIWQTTDSPSGLYIVSASTQTGPQQTEISSIVQLLK